MKCALLLIMAMLLLSTGCGEAKMEYTYRQITQEEARKMMDTHETIILDVREQQEFDTGHIPGVVLLPVNTITKATAAAVIPKRNSIVLIYCRSGNRSRRASSTLEALGYSSIYEFGGINTWPYEVEQ